MGKTLKKVLIVFILLCVVALIVLLAEMFIFGDKPGDGDTKGEEPPATSSESETPPTGTTTPPTETEPSTPSTSTETTPETPTAPVGKEYKIEMPSGNGKNISVFVNEELFEFEDPMIGAIFALKDSSAGSAKLEIGFALNGDAESLAPGLLENYLPDYMESDTSTEEMGTTGLSGWWAQAKDGSETYEAWLIDRDECVLLVVIDYKNTAQRDMLVEIINTLKIV